ncbi:hypothetical protein TYRP_022433 [Tyrophagus putrescentiae]|nr:hypothetical protein TYRP_022433 [Tyrophagus putrescentiae]
MPQLHALAQPQLPLPRRTKATLKSGLEEEAKQPPPTSAVADAPASCTGPAATPSASAEPKPPSKVASKEEAKQPPPTSAVADAPASCTGPAATPSASAEPKPPSKVASKEEAKQPPPTSAVADAPASCTGPAATPSASTEPKPPSKVAEEKPRSKVASKEEAKQPPPTSASKSKLGFSMGSKAGDFSVLSSASGFKVGGQGTLSAASGTGGSSCAQSAISALDISKTLTTLGRADLCRLRHLALAVYLDLIIDENGQMVDRPGDHSIHCFAMSMTARFGSGAGALSLCTLSLHAQL